MRMLPTFNHQGAVRAVLHPGDQLYFPWLWWHTTWGDEGDVSISFTHFWNLEKDDATAKKDALAMAHPDQLRCMELQGVPFMAAMPAE